MWSRNKRPPNSVGEQVIRNTPTAEACQRVQGADQQPRTSSSVFTVGSCGIAVDHELSSSSPMHLPLLVQSVYQHWVSLFTVAEYQNGRAGASVSGRSRVTHPGDNEERPSINSRTDQFRPPDFRSSVLPFVMSRTVLVQREPKLRGGHDSSTERNRTRGD
jgi:hypothetical protein